MVATGSEVQVSPVRPLHQQSSINDFKYSNYLAQFKRFVRDHWAQKGYGPTVRELTHAVGFSSTSVTTHWMEKFRYDGHLLYEDHEGRTIRLPGQTVVFADEVTAQ